MQNNLYNKLVKQKNKMALKLKEIIFKYNLNMINKLKLNRNLRI